MTCKCIDQMDDHLKNHNSKLVVDIPFHQGQLTGLRAHLQTEKINTRDRRSMGAIATYCPFCGTKYLEAE